MADTAPKAGGDAPARPLGPDGKPIPGPAEVRQIQAARKMAQQQEQVGSAMEHVDVDDGDASEDDAGRGSDQHHAQKCRECP